MNYGTLMKQRVLALLMMAGDLACFTGYCFAWLDWIRDLTEGIYARNQQEAALETSALMAYSYGAIRFMNRRLNP